MVHNKKIPSFDPNTSLIEALTWLKKSQISKFALIGRVATWVYLGEEQHQFTKDVDIAVRVEDMSTLQDLLDSMKIKYNPLSIGGIAIREREIQIDFIDRRVHQVSKLFEEAITKAVNSIPVEKETIPVVPLEYLVAMKMVSGETKDDHDVESLLEVKDLDYKLTRKITDLFLGPFVADRLDVFARKVGILPKRGPYLYGN